MCGIAGSLNFSNLEKTVHRVMGHRGPDDRRSLTWNNLSLYHLRLAIQAISTGAQPMLVGDRYAIIFNGEIYNHNDVRAAHPDLGCLTPSDTETLLRAFIKNGVSCLHEMDGMFTFAILDKMEQKLWLGRDRAGKKPLYIYKNGEKVAFASELACLHAMTGAVPSDERIAEYLRLGMIFDRATVYSNITELGAGSWACIDLQTAEITDGKWWSIGDQYKKLNDDDFETAFEKVDLFIQKAVTRRIDSSDLEVGAFLSGGIDSGLVTAYGSLGRAKKLKTFTVAFEGPYDESPMAAQVAEMYGTEHTEIRIDFSNLQNDLERIIGGYGEPFSDSSAIPSWYVSQAARQHITVVLNGDGADELFGGYRRYWPYAKLDLFRPQPLPIKWAASAFLALAPKSNDKTSALNFPTRLAALIQKEGLERYLSATTDIFDGFSQHLRFGDAPIKSLRDRFEQIAAKPTSSLQKVMQLDFEHILFGDLLVKMDIATMAHSIEGRSPLLSKELLEYVPSLPDDFKIRGSQSKYLLRRLAQKYLPAETAVMPKRGFEIPLKNWLDGMLRPMLGDFLTASDALFPNFVDKKFMLDLLENRTQVPAEKRAKMLWTVFCLEIWAKSLKTRPFATLETQHG